MAIESRIDEDGQEWLSHLYLDYGDYGGSGTVGIANIRCLQEDLADEFLDIDYGSYGYRKLWVRADAPDIRETLEALDDYPLIDDEMLSIVEDELAEEQFPIDDIVRKLDSELEDGTPISFPEYVRDRIKADGYWPMTQNAHYLPWHAEGSGDQIYFDVDRIVSHAIGYYVPQYLQSESGLEYRLRVKESVVLLLSEGNFNEAGCGAWKAVCRSAGEKLPIDPTDIVQLSAFSDYLAETRNVRHWLQDIVDGMLECRCGR